ncbi:MAG: hypothetical protein M3250_00610 [Thermoproteota archaeon]|nr:hypothetical protein [Thermoproteota archaeon]
MHYWVGSFCRVLNKRKALFPSRVIAVCDIITLIADNGNQIPDKCWMLYLLEVFNAQNIAVELNLICQFDNQDYFEAIFNGVNQYRFKHILPMIGHSYLRQIIMDAQNKIIKYILIDQKTKESETFDLSLANMNFEFVATNHFTGIEWWNKIGNFPYPPRYIVEISLLMFGLGDRIDSDSITYLPHNALIPTNDGSGSKYPISFQSIRINNECICYTVKPGYCHTGIRYNC